MSTKKVSPWAWVPTLYFAQGLPYVAVMTIAVIMYKRLGLSNADIALYTSWLYLPWVIKPLWSPFIDLIKTKRMWVTLMQSLVAVGFAGVAFFIPTESWVQMTLAFFWLMAFSSATHDIAADGFYMLGLTEGEQSLFVGIRNTFYRFATIFGQGILVMIAGYLESGKILPSVVQGNNATAWSLCFYLLAVIFIILTVYHILILPRPDSDVSRDNITAGGLMKDFIGTFVSFFQKNNIGLALFFILTYRLGESQLVKIASPFLLDTRDAGGLALSTETVGLAYGTIGVIGLLLGGIIGGICISRGGLKKWILPMALAINLPDLLYVLLAYTQTESIYLTIGCIFCEQLGYGFGFTAYTLYLVYIAQGLFKTAHYSIGTGLMALGMMLPGMVAGYLQEWTGYPVFFVIVCILTIPGIFASYLVMKKLPADFGKMDKIQNTPPALQLPTSRGLVKMILLGIVTLGIYPLAVYSKISTEINTVAMKYDGQHTMHYCLVYFIFSWLTLGIVPLIWYHKISARIGNELKRRSITYDFGASDFWLWNILGSLIIVGPFIYVHKFMHAMNQLNADYNQKG